MAESVVTGTSLSAGSEALFDIVCQPCSSENIIAEAEGYCQDCFEHLCAQCINCHKKVTVSKHHQLMDKENMPNRQDPPPVRDVCTEACRVHKGEILKYFCPAHDVLGCTVCITLKHKLCEDVAYIPEIVTDIEDSKCYKEFNVKLDDLIQRSKDTAECLQKSKKRLSDCLVKAISDIEAYRQDIIDAVDTKVNVLKARSGKIHTQETDKMNKLADDNNQVMIELQSVLSKFSTLLNKKQYCQMFIEIKRKEEDLAGLDEKLQNMEGTDVSDYKYAHDEDVPTTLSRESGLGKMVMTKAGKIGSTAQRNLQNGASTSKPGAVTRDIHRIKATHMADINAKSSSNTHQCSIFGLALLSTEILVVSDYDNGTIKLIDTKNNKIISEHKPEKSPWDVTICGDKVAATLPGAEKILFMKYINALEYDSDISVGDECKGIDCCDDKLFVLFKIRKKLEIMTMTGVVLKRFETNEQGGRLFEYPLYVTVSRTNKSIYVSEWQNGQLIILDMDGKLKGVYEDSGLGFPKQLAVDKAGVMFLCDYRHKNVHMLSPRSTKVKILLTKRDGVTRPMSTCYCEITGRLYVGGHMSDMIKVYQVS